VKPVEGWDSVGFLFQQIYPLDVFCGSTAINPFRVGELQSFYQLVEFAGNYPFMTCMPTFIRKVKAQYVGIESI